MLGLKPARLMLKRRPKLKPMSVMIIMSGPTPVLLCFIAAKTPPKHDDSARIDNWCFCDSIKFDMVTNIELDACLGLGMGFGGLSASIGLCMNIVVLFRSGFTSGLKLLLELMPKTKPKPIQKRFQGPSLC